MIKQEEVLRGKTFGRLIVVERIEDYISSNGNHIARWKCQCNCEQKTLVDVRADHLVKMEIQSCGCLKKENASRIFKKYNDYKIQEDYVIMYTQKGEPFFVDLEDFWKVKDTCWSINKDGYLIGYEPNKTIIYLHRVIMNCPDDMLVDHIHGKKSRNDNRKENLRIVTRSQNNINVGLKKNNTSGYTGVSWDKNNNMWSAYITINCKRKHLGRFNNLNDAVKTRKEAEEKYFGEYSYDNSQNT